MVIMDKINSVLCSEICVLDIADGNERAESVEPKVEILVESLVN